MWLRLLFISLSLSKSKVLQLAGKMRGAGAMGHSLESPAPRLLTESLELLTTINCTTGACGNATKVPLMFVYMTGIWGNPWVDGALGTEHTEEEGPFDDTQADFGGETTVGVVMHWVYDGVVSNDVSKTVGGWSLLHTDITGVQYELTVDTALIVVEDTTSTVCDTEVVVVVWALEELFGDTMTETWEEKGDAAGGVIGREISVLGGAFREESPTA